jgi:hypothetical protein
MSITARIICHLAIKNDFSAILEPTEMAEHRKSDRRRDDLCAGGLRKRAELSLPSLS